MTIALDAMGGDSSPAAEVEGAVLAAREYNADIVLVGDEKLLRSELDKHRTAGLPITICHASQRVEMHESPVSVLRKKKDSSIVVATKLVRDEKASAVVSAGHTGAAMAASLLILGPVKGVERPAIAALLLKKAFASFKKKVDYAEYGGAPLLGVNGVSIICHGRSTPKAIKNAIRMSVKLSEVQTVQYLQKDVSELMEFFKEDMN